MAIYITSDTHFGHTNIIKYCKRPFKSTKDMDKIIIKNWNKIVKPDDIIWHLGDFSLTGADRTRELVNLLNGYKILIVGNHDKKPNKMKSYGFDEVYHGIRLYDYKLLTHVPIFIEGMLTINVGVDQWGFKPIPMPKEKRIILSGHVHEIWKVKGYDDEKRNFKWLGE